jgi:UDP-glucose 4-epimerase
VRVLVTGGTGFIGSYVVGILTEQGHAPVVLDRRLPKFQPESEWQLGDIRDASAVMQAVESVGGVIHLAGLLGTQESINRPDVAVATNIVGSLNVFRAVRDFKIPAVYIAVGNHWMNNPYSITKTTAERFALMANAEWGTRIAVVRGMNAYGPGQKSHPVRKLVPNLILPALRGESVILYGDGEQVMDMLYVGDLANVLVRALTYNHGVYDHAFEAGSGEKTTVNDVLAAVERAIGRSIPVRYEPMRPGEPEASVVFADVKTLHPLGLDLSGFVSLDDGIRWTVEYYRKGLG